MGDGKVELAIVDKGSGSSYPDAVHVDSAVIHEAVMIFRVTELGRDLVVAVRREIELGQSVRLAQHGSPHCLERRLLLWLRSTAEVLFVDSGAGRDHRWDGVGFTVIHGELQRAFADLQVTRCRGIVLKN